ncbi:MAG: hypothetical protein NZ761_06475 [Dehalococcoidia bacterium]|nr:hypothetical protein [Dehalococcoidia bacterium]
MNLENYSFANAVALVEVALADLDRARRELERDTFPATPLPRPRRFVLGPGAVWPSDYLGRTHWNEVAVNERVYTIGGGLESDRGQRRTAAEALVAACGGQPRCVLRTVRRIQAAAAWALARAEGRRRMAAEILAQQRRALEAIEGEIVLQQLAGKWPQR